LNHFGRTDAVLEVDLLCVENLSDAHETKHEAEKEKWLCKTDE